MLNRLPVCAAVLEDIVAMLREKYPQLKINYVPATGTAWVVIHRPDTTLYSPNHPPVYDPHLVLTLVDGNVTTSGHFLRTSPKGCSAGR